MPPVDEFKRMVRTFHDAGIDNPTYYRLVAESPRYYMDYTGCGNTLNMRQPQVLQLIMDSLRYWVTDMHVDGFRFDLASALARELHEVDRLFLDYAGSTVPIRDPKTGDVALDAQVFVAVLGFSNYVFAEATPSQDLSSWIGSHVRCFEFLGGVPALLVPVYVVHHIIRHDLWRSFSGTGSSSRSGN